MILLPFSLLQSFRPRAVGGPGAKGLAVLRHLLCARWTPQESLVVKPSCRFGASCSEAKNRPSSPSSLEAGQGLKSRSWSICSASCCLKSTERWCGCSSESVFFQHPGSAGLSQTPLDWSHLLSPAVCELTAPSLFEKLGLASPCSFLSRRNALSCSASVSS